MNNDVKTPVEALRRGLKILEILSSSDPSAGLSLSEIATRMELRPNTTHNILKTLCMCEYAVNIGTGRYRMGCGAQRLVRNQVFSGSISHRLTQILSGLSGQIREDVVLTALINGSRRVIARSSGGGSIRVSTSATDIESKYVWSTVTGRALAAFCSSTELEALIAQSGYPGPTWNDIDTKDDLDRELSLVHEQRYAEQLEHGEVVSLAVPILSTDGSLIAALGVHLPFYRFGDARRKELLEALEVSGQRLAAIVRSLMSEVQAMEERNA